MGYEFDPNRYEGDEEPSTTDQVPNSTATKASEKNKDVDCSGGITELKVIIINKCLMI